MNRIITWVQRHTGIVFTAFVIIVLAVFARFHEEATVYPVSHDRMVEVSNGDQHEPSKTLGTGDSLSYTFDMKYASFYGVRIPIELKGDNKEGNVQVTITDETAGEVLAEKTFELADLSASDPEVTVLLDEVDDTINGHKLNWTLTVTELADGTDLNLYCTTASAKNHEVYLYTMILNKTSFLGAYYNLILILILVSVCILGALVYKKAKVESLFLVIALLVGFLYSLTVTPFSAPDEEAHFYSTYYVSDKLMGCGESSDGTIQMRKADTATYGLYEELDKTSYNAVYEALGYQADEAKLVEQKTETVGVLDYFYLPGAIGITLARLFHMNTMLLMYVGRFFNMLAFILLAFFAIRKMPFAKSVMTLVAVSPMVLHQVASFSYDAVIYGLAFLFTAWCMKGIYEKGNLNWRTLVGILVTGCLLAPAKSGAYLPICFLLVLIPRLRFKSKKGYLMAVWGGVALFVIAAAMNFVILSSGTVASGTENIVTWTGTAMPTYSFSNILESPRWFIQIMACTFATKLSGYFTTMFGAVMSSYNVYISTIWTVLFMFVVALASVRQDREEQLVKTTHKIWIGLLVIGVVCLVEVGMLVGWTPQGYSTIEGVQGRYFLPVLPLMLLMLRNGTLTVKKNLTPVLCMSALGLNALIIMEIFAQALTK